MQKLTIFFVNEYFCQTYLITFLFNSKSLSLTLSVKQGLLSNHTMTVFKLCRKIQFLAVDLFVSLRYIIFHIFL